MYFYTPAYPLVNPWTRENPFHAQAFLDVQQHQAAPATFATMNAMGQLIDKAKRTATMQTKTAASILPIRIVELEAKIENRPTIVDEKSPAVLKYRTPHFRAAATIKFPPLADDEVWKIGWIQSCRRMDFFNSYGDSGYSSWEFPQLMSGLQSMISDSDGRNYPFYGSKSEVIEVQGPTADYRTIQVLMNDNFYPHITWDIPTSNERLARLTNVKRHQSFYTWLVAMNARTGSILVLKTISWQMNLEIDVDASQPAGSRATLLSNPIPLQPEILKDNVRIPTGVLYPPNANSAQILVWHPGCRLGELSQRPEIVVPPRCMSILHENPFYDHYIRHKTHTSIQNKLNSGSSLDNGSHTPQVSTSKPYTRIIYPPSRDVVQAPPPLPPSSSSVHRCYRGMKYILDDHAQLAQGIVVR